MPTHEQEQPASDIPQVMTEVSVSPQKRQEQRERNQILRDVATLLPELLGAEFGVPRTANVTLVPNDSTITWWEIRSVLQHVKECRTARKQAAEKAAKAKGALERAQAKVKKSTDRRDALEHQVSKSNDKRLANQLNEAEGTLAKHVEELAATPAQIDAWQQQDHEAGQALEIAERVVGTMHDTLRKASEILRSTVPAPALASTTQAPASVEPVRAPAESRNPQKKKGKDKMPDKKPHKLERIIAINPFEVMKAAAPKPSGKKPEGSKPKFSTDHLRPGESSGPNVPTKPISPSIRQYPNGPTVIDVGDATPQQAADFMISSLNLLRTIPNPSHIATASVPGIGPNAQRSRRDEESRELAAVARLPKLTEAGFAPFAQPGSSLQIAYATKLSPLLNDMLRRKSTQPFVPFREASGSTIMGYQYVNEAGQLDAFQSEVAFRAPMGTIEIDGGIEQWCRDMLAALNQMILAERTQAGGDAHAYMVNKLLCSGAKVSLSEKVLAADPKQRLYLAMQLARCPEVSATPSTRISYIGIVRQLLTNILFGARPTQREAQVSLIESFDYGDVNSSSLQIPYTAPECIDGLAAYDAHSPVARQMMETFVGKLYALVATENPSANSETLTNAALQQWNKGYQPLAIAKERLIECRLQGAITPMFPEKMRYAFAQHALIEMQGLKTGSVGQAMAATRFTRAVKNR